MFLVGLNQELDEVCGKILGRKPLPSMQEIEREKKIKIILSGNSKSNTEQSTERKNLGRVEGLAAA